MQTGSVEVFLDGDRPMAMDLPLRLSDSPSLGQVFTPVNVAILASLGLHGFILGLALPHWQWQESTGESLEDRNPVGVIELTPAEQSRLPETDIFSAGALFPTAPDGSAPGAIAADPNLPTPPGGDYNYSLPSGPGIMPPPPAMPNLPAYPNLPPLTSYGNLSRLPITNPPIPSLPQIPSTRQIPRPPGLFSPTPDQGINPLGPSPNRPNFGSLPPSQGTGFITRAPQGTNTPQEPGLTAEGEDTSPEKLRENTLVSIAQQGQALKAKDTINGAYPPIACRNRTEAQVVYNLFPNGQRDLVGRSRYPIFNQLAEQAIANRSYGEPTQVTVSFKYDAELCGGINQFIPSGGENPSLPTVPPPSQTTPAPAVTPAPGIAPTLEPQRPRPTTPPISQPQTAPPEVRSSPIPDAPVPRRQTASPAPSAPPVNVVPVPTRSVPTPTVTPAPTSSQPSLPKTKGEMLLEQNQAPSIVPPQPNGNNGETEADEPQSQAPSLNNNNGLPGPIQSKK
ncbi:hypothetical protein [Synechocystis sp. PCC 6714]|uniref:hypothetical protein n=2 Tax=unclassified Synechocystis TaxID=2640012 RepID=UPI00048D5F37|nr:hypothetical protein [Synechocystis sp. PCC 6714]MCT0253078.1 hypothetical protein [Synechocystis sp. CS-94]